MYTTLYKRKLKSSDQAVKNIKNGSTIVHGLAAAEPPALLRALADRCRLGGLKDIKVHSLLATDIVSSTLLAPDLSDCVEAYSWFVSKSSRSAVKVGLDYFVPNHFHQVPRLMKDYLDIDLVVTTVSPMDKAGFFSFGTANDYTSTVARCCKRLIVEVNKNMPRVFGDSLLHVSEVDAIVENDAPLVEYKWPAARPEDDMIGKQIAEMVPDGATIQLGFGGLPNVIANHLMHHKDLGIHTEVFGPSMVDLIKKGAVTGRKKNLHPGKHVFTVAEGTKEMYEFMDDNPSMESYPVSYTNDPNVVARNDNMISINSIIQVDLLGQCNAEFLAGSQFSGTGGQLDYVRGAFNSRGGKSILAFYSTAKDGKISRVVPKLDPGAVITTPRMDVHYLVTEYGVINLKGKSTKDRALDIISIAHPDFRDRLLKEAENMYLL
ncbi:MAG: acetyl-CoA hydrolase/transferase C-terminal domain-containing protein [Dehalococcoidia bacterium]|nr:acetyl-CoA hydrolase/transferase C-terminal domain-containing protein [Dehalococcoidia bacterium]MDD5494723.1 acetyl-CoA hydrolase/transferase C-terminal domain-containing protein [Dehalococcoidia bacterium]